MAKGTAVLRVRNEKRVLAYLRRRRTSSRQQIAETLGLGKNTVSLIVERFLRRGIVVETGRDAAGVGRPRIEVALIPGALHSIGISIRDKYYEWMVMDYADNVLVSDRVHVDTRDMATCLNLVGEHCRRLLQTYPNTVGIGIAVPGMVDPHQGVVQASTHLGWTQAPIARTLQEFTPGVPLKVINRVKAAALSPVREVLDDEGSTFYVRIDEGVGGALVIGREIVQGATWTAGEIGHIAVDPHGPRCACGQRGCLEALVSLPALRKRFAAAIGLHLSADGLLHPIAGIDLETWDAEMARLGGYVGVASALVVNLVNPSRVIIDSPYGHDASFRAAVNDSVRARALPHPCAHTHFEFVCLQRASAMGAAHSMIVAYESEEEARSSRTLPVELNKE